MCQEGGRTAVRKTRLALALRHRRQLRPGLRPGLRPIGAPWSGMYRAAFLILLLLHDAMVHARLHLLALGGPRASRLLVPGAHERAVYLFSLAQEQTVQSEIARFSWLVVSL